jgi:hypothetical protein
LIETRGIFLTLRWRLTLLYTALIALLLTGVFVAVYSQISSNIRQNLESDLNSNLEQIRRLNQANDRRHPINDALTNDWSSISQETFAVVLQFPFEPDSIDLQSFSSLQPTSFQNPTLEQLGADIRLNDDDYVTLLRNREFAGRGYLSLEPRKPVEVRAFIEPDVINGNGESTNITNVILVARDPSANDELLATLQRTLRWLVQVWLPSAHILWRAVPSSQFVRCVTPPVRLPSQTFRGAFQNQAQTTRCKTWRTP